MGLSSDASRPLSQPRSGILTPASDGSVNLQSPRASGSRRKASSAAVVGPSDAAKRPDRKRLALPMEELLKPSIVVKPHPQNILARPVILQPLMLLPRDCLPLAHIDFSDPYGELPPARFFESRIRIMELEGRLGSNVLIARSDPSRTTYAFERHANGHYTVCKLGSWVDIADLTQDSTVICSERLRLVSKAKAVTSGHFEPPLATLHLYKESKRKRQAIEDLQSLCKKRQLSQPVAGLATQQQSQSQLSRAQLPTPVDDAPLVEQPVADPPTEHQPESQPSQGALQLPDTSHQASEATLDTQQTAGDIFTHIRTQYFDALYHSMGSLAYFAKGPLSRARAAFHLNCDGNLEMADLIGFLKSLVLTTILIDKKYLTTISSVIEQMKFVVESSDEGGTRRLKKKLPKKMKIGKDGLYPTEGDNVKKWWTSTKPELRDEETSVSAQQVRYHISCLRRRETLLQLILILEILSLEASHQLENNAEVQLPGLEGTSEPVVKQPNVDGAKKKRSKHNYPVLLDVHADRLCIWESTTLDEVKALAESQSKTGDIRKSDKPLVEFCVDVILPFFSPRLPELCDSLNRKLGGPVLQSPPKQRREKGPEASNKSWAKPGAPIKRPASKPASSRPARSLERVLSNDKLRRSVSRGLSDALAHLRHATVAHVPGLKREASETRSLKDAPSAETGSLMDRPASLLHSRSASFTSVDDARAKKKALVEAELQDAISALKKPNRVLAGKVLVEETERRLFAGPTYVTKSKKPLRSPMNKVQVKATPANYRFKDALADDPRHGRGFNLSRAHQTLQPATMLPQVSETSRLGLGGSPCVANTPLVKKSQHISAEAYGRDDAASPHRRSSDFVPTSSPIQARKTAPRPQPSQWAQPAPSRGLLFLPGKVDMVPASSPQRPLDDADDPLSIKTMGNTRTTLWSRSVSGSLVETPVKPRSRLISASDAAVSGLIAATPSATRTTATILPSIAVSPPNAKTKTIYQQLGWDDDYPDELS